MPSSDRIADFVSVDAGYCIVRDEVCEELRARFAGFSCEGVEVVDQEGPRDPAPFGSTAIVPYPYTGPRLVEIWPTAWVEADAASSIEIRIRCPECGYVQSSVKGAEKVDPGPDVDVHGRFPRVPRSAGMGIFVRTDALGEADIFRVREHPLPVLCTDRVRRFVEEQGYTGADFLEMGELIS